MESIGTCKVQEIAFSRKIELTSECKGGTVFMGDVTEVLREGDAVFLDYVVGLNGTREEVCCDLVWHGRRPRGAWQMSPEEFGQRLQIDTQDAVNSLCFEDVETEIERAEVASRVVPPGCPQTLGCRTTRTQQGQWNEQLGLCGRSSRCSTTGGGASLAGQAGLGDYREGA
ncbi:uncharacterized protein LOC144159403 [Haemaphysalis longicornis]